MLNTILCCAFIHVYNTIRVRLFRCRLSSTFSLLSTFLLYFSLVSLTVFFAVLLSHSLCCAARVYFPLARTRTTFIMFSAITTTATLLALSFLSLPSSARVVWIPEEFDPLAGNSPLLRRDTLTCGGDASLSQCGNPFPSDFCCPSGTTCLSLNATSSVAAICCPEGQACSVLNVVSCDQNAQNATLVPSSNMHSDPTQQLDECGAGCCPMGYGCKNNQCVAKAEAAGAGDPTTTSSPKATHTATDATSTTTVAAAAGGKRPLGAPNSEDSDDFNGKSFAAGFIPGIVIGAIIAALLLLFLFRKRRRSLDSDYNEKHNNRDTLTDLGTLDRRPTMHGRSISEPQVDPSAFQRTDFLRTSPPRALDLNGSNTNGNAPARGPATPSSGPPKIKALFSRSPFMNQTPSTPPSIHPPVPAHLKRGTLSFKISPVRALKKQKSSHSLRRQMTDASNGADNARRNSRRRLRPDLSRSASTETIQVLMPSNEPYTPDRPAQIAEEPRTLEPATYNAPKSSTSTWNSTSSSPDDTPDLRQQPQAQTPYASSSRYPSSVQPYNTPTRPPIPRLPVVPKEQSYSFLGSPYTPTNHAAATGKGRGGLRPPGSLTVDPSDSKRRDTTFSAMMEKAGLRKSDLIMGTGSRKA